MNNDYLTEARSLLSYADGREGPEDTQYATQLVIARAAIAQAAALERIADALETMNERATPEYQEQATQDRLRATWERIDERAAALEAIEAEGY